MRGLSIVKRPINANKQLYIVLCVMGTLSLLGVFCGATLLKFNSFGISSNIEVFAKSFLQNHKIGNFITLASFTFLYSMLLHLIVFILGFSCIGAIFILFAPFIKGLFVGFISGYLYSSGLHGILTNLIMLWLPQAISIFVLTLFATYAFRLSCGLFSEIILKDKKCAERSVKIYVKVFIFTGLILLINAFFESALSGIFAPILI